MSLGSLGLAALGLLFLACARRAAPPGSEASGTSTIDRRVQSVVRAELVGTVLDRAPRYVALVGLVGPREGGTGPKSSASIFARIAAALAR